MKSPLLVPYSVSENPCALPRRESAVALKSGEFVAMALFGAGSALMLAFFPLDIAVPGHAVLKAFLPMAAGIALASSRGSGAMMSASGAAVALGLLAGGYARIQPAALASLIALGPLLDILPVASASGWRRCFRFMSAAIAANLLAFCVRLGIALTGMDAATSRNFLGFWPTALVGFLACGALAGVIGGTICWLIPRRTGRAP